MRKRDTEYWIISMMGIKNKMVKIGRIKGWMGMKMILRNSGITCFT